MLSFKKTVLIIGDEALYLYETGKGSRLVDAVPWGAENFQETVSKLIIKECGGKPVVIVNDMVEQHYRKERVPSVGFLDKKSVVNRKLAISFPNYPIRAALPLKEKAESSGRGPAASLYIFAAAPSTEAFQKTMGAANKSLVTVSGYALLPVESASMISTLSSKMTRRGAKRPKWSVFIGQHRSGSLRQVVIRDGELALTRMTPIVDTDVDADRWSTEVYQEFQATLSYMARFGFVKEDGLDVTIIASNESGATLETLMSEVGAQLYTLNVSEAAEKLGLSISPQAEAHYADVLHAAWIGKRAKLTLPMQATAVNEISRPRQIANVASFLMVGSAAFFAYQFYDNYMNVISKSGELSKIQSQQQTLDIEYNKEVERKEKLGIDVRLLKAAISLHGQMEEEDIKPLRIFRGVGKAIGSDLRLDEVNMRRIKKDLFTVAQSAINQYANNTEEEPIYEALLKLSFPGTTDVDIGNKEVDNLANRIQAMFPKHDVEVEKYLKDTAYVDDVVIGADQEDQILQDYVASVSIRGGQK